MKLTVAFWNGYSARIKVLRPLRLALYHSILDALGTLVHITSRFHL